MQPSTKKPKSPPYTALREPYGRSSDRSEDDAGFMLLTPSYTALQEAHRRSSEGPEDDGGFMVLSFEELFEDDFSESEEGESIKSPAIDDVDALVARLAALRTAAGPAAAPIVLTTAKPAVLLPELPEEDLQASISSQVSEPIDMLAGSIHEKDRLRLNSAGETPAMSLAPRLAARLKDLQEMQIALTAQGLTLAEYGDLLTEEVSQRQKCLKLYQRYVALKRDDHVIRSSEIQAAEVCIESLTTSVLASQANSPRRRDSWESADDGSPPCSHKDERGAALTR